MPHNTLSDYRGQRCVMGIDVGLVFHVVIRELGGLSRLWFVGEVETVQELLKLEQKYHVQRAVIDALPETRQAAEFARRHLNENWVCLYGRQQPGYGKDIESDPRVLHVNRTEALDAIFARFRGRVVELPKDARQLGGRVKQGLGEYYREMRVLQRTLERDGQGNVVARWNDRGKDDHYAHSEVYAWLAEDAGTPWPEFYVSS